jgi:hypothetical protein
VAADVTSTELAPPAPQPAPAPPVQYPHRPRFLFVYGMLGGVLAAALVVLVIYAGRSITPAPKWSHWHPSGGGLGAAKQIADDVGKSYRLPNGDQLVDVIAKAPSVSATSTTSIPIHYVAVRGTGGKADQVILVSSSNSMMYSLCGLGTACSISTGKASVARGNLVRREILELALYTFKYVGGINNIIAFMPPPSGSQAQYVIYLQKNDVSAELKRPLAETLGAKVPLPAAIPEHELHAINSVTEPRVYKFGLSQAQLGDAVLVLTPLRA